MLLFVQIVSRGEHNENKTYRNILQTLLAFRLQLQLGVSKMTSKLELRCVECRWLDPTLWTNSKRCNCTHYWEQEKTPETVQTTVLRDEQGTLWEINELRRWMRTDLSS